MKLTESWFASGPPLANGRTKVHASKHAVHVICCHCVSVQHRPPSASINASIVARENKIAVSGLCTTHEIAERHVVQARESWHHGQHWKARFEGTSLSIHFIAALVNR